MFNKEWAFASSETLRNDPQGRVPSDVIFESKGYAPRNPEAIFYPSNWEEQEARLEKSKNAQR